MENDPQRQMALVFFAVLFVILAVVSVFILAANGLLTLKRKSSISKMLRDGMNGREILEELLLKSFNQDFVNTLLNSPEYPNVIAQIRESTGNDVQKAVRTYLSASVRVSVIKDQIAKADKDETAKLNEIPELPFSAVCVIESEKLKWNEFGSKGAVESGDIVYACNGVLTTNSDELKQVFKSVPKDGYVTLDVVRSHDPMDDPKDSAVAIQLGLIGLFSSQLIRAADRVFEDPFDCVKLQGKRSMYMAKIKKVKNI